MKHWIKAFRLRTLPLALSCIFMGNFIAVLHSYHGEIRTSVAVLAILTTIFLQILSNLANDLGDSQHGADSDQRTGPSRTVQSGEISSAQMKRAVYVFLILSLISGCYLLYMAFGTDLGHYLSFLGLGLLSIAGAVYYTMGKNPYGYMGLGDISVYLFFGLLGVGGTYFLHLKTLSVDVLLLAHSCGMFSVGVLNLNNVRDIDSDEKAGKHSIPVRIGKRKAILYHWFLLLSGFGSAVVYAFLNFNHLTQWAFLLTFPLFLLNGIKLQKAENSGQIDPLLKQLALSTLIFVLVFGTFALL